ncbi:unnamed protein product [marine sediment metagenome]|uniref:TFIIS-type domain-containing protein n=1 Tax=marine sediment metagenome TaxID=412755 RepID=X0Z769_9ZZZZ
MVDFCDECGGLMIPTKDDTGKIIFRCKSCRKTKSLDGVEEDHYSIKKKIEHSIRREITSASAILKWKDENLKSAIKNFKCPKCGYDKAGIETRQTRSADEGMTHFIICLKCGKMKKIGS